MQEAYKIANQNSQKAHLQNKRQYDKKANFFTQLEKCDRVLVRNLTPRRGPGKLRLHWEEEIYVVADQKGRNPVYTVVPEGHKGKSRVIHHNLLLPCPYVNLPICHQSLQIYTHLNLPHITLQILQHLIPDIPITLTTTNPTKPIHNVPLEKDVHLCIKVLK